MDEGHVLVQASSVVGEALVSDLATFLTGEGLSVVVGPGLGGSPSWAQQHDAAAVLVVAGAEHLPDELPFSVNRFAADGLAVVVRVDAQDAGPSGWANVPLFRLRTDSRLWASSAAPLVRHLHALVASGLHRRVGRGLDEEGIHVVTRRIEELEGLTDKIVSLGEVLSDDDEHSEAVRETLAEITGTYRVVKSAIESFAVAGHAMSQQRGGGFAALAHGVLADSIHNGRAHCTRIGIRYEKVGGLRDALKGRLPREHLASLNETFETLANADGDVFSAMDSVGEILTTEARLIDRLLLTRRTPQAEEEFARAMDGLAPLEEALDRAISDMRNVSVTLGYAEKVAQKETAYVTNQTITIHGSVVNSAVVAADRIENSAIKVGAAEISDELRSTLVDLHKAVAELTSRLPDDEAALAARDLEDLSREATSPSPRPAWWRRAVDGLLSAAKTVTDAGIPVIELVTKVAALLG